MQFCGNTSLSLRFSSDFLVGTKCKQNRRQKVFNGGALQLVLNKKSKLNFNDKDEFP